LSRCGARRIERPVRLNDHRPRARGTVSPSVSGNVIDRVRRYLRRVDQDISGLDEGSVGEIVALVVVHDRTEVGVGVADINCCRIAALNVD